MQLSLTENGGCKSGSAAISGPSVCESADAIAASLCEAACTVSTHAESMSPLLRDSLRHLEAS